MCGESGSDMWRIKKKKKDEAKDAKDAKDEKVT
jgi:predicted secreted protein